MYVHTDTDIRRHIHTHIHTRVCTQTHTQTHVYAHRHTHRHTRICTHTQTDTHTHAGICTATCMGWMLIVSYLELLASIQVNATMYGFNNAHA